MMTEFLRDHLFTVAWYGLMCCVWLGWGQEDPPKRLRPFLGVGSVIGLGLTIWFGIQVAKHWSEPSALDTNLVAYIVLVAAEVVLCGAGAIALTVKGKGRWIAWWIGTVVAVHFVPLGVILADLANVALGVGLTVALLVVRPRLARSEGTTSALVGPLLGFSLLAFSIVSALLVLPRL